MDESDDQNGKIQFDVNSEIVKELNLYDRNKIEESSPLDYLKKFKLFFRISRKKSKFYMPSQPPQSRQNVYLVMPGN